jgi:TPR repeat protein
MFRKNLAFLLLSVLVFGALFAPAEVSAEEEYDPQHTMLALNMAAVSIYQITSTGDRIILDQEYRNILNNLSIGNIEGDYEIIDLYEQILDIITYEKLRDEEAKRFDAAYERSVKNNMLRAASGIRAYGGNLWSFVGSLLTSASASYFDYRFSKEEYQADLDESLWGLKRERILDLNDLRKQLLRSSWRLLRQYGLPDEYRVTEENLKLFTLALEEPDPERALVMFDTLQKDFRAYPPFWYFYGHAAQELGNNDLARQCYATFDKVHRKVLRRDPFLVEVCKNKIPLLNPYTEQEEIRNCARLIGENSSPQDWLNNLIAGVQFYLLGEKEEAARYVRQNVAFQSELDLSSLLLEAMASGTLRKEALPEVLQKFVQTIPPAEKLAASGKGKEASAHGLELYFQGEYAQALEYFKASAEENDPLGVLMCMIMYKSGQGTEVHTEVAEKYGRRLDQVEESEEIEKDFKESLERIQKHAHEGNADAQFLSGFFAGDAAEEVKWYRKAAEQGHATALNELGNMYYHGRGVPQNDSEAVKWYRKAAEQGNAMAQYDLGWMYQNGRGVPQNDSEAAKWYRKAAEQGDAEAQALLGVMYYNGLGVPQNDTEAVKWYRKAAEQGNATAQSWLGFMYDEGRGVSQNDTEAVKWYRKAAEQGNADAQNRLGLMYDEGRGVPQNDSEAVKWYRKAAEQGLGVAQNNLGWMYRNGEGVPQDMETAYMWFYIAVTNGYKDAQKWIDELEEKGFFTKAKVSPQEIARAKQRAREFLAKQQQ